MNQPRPLPDLFSFISCKPFFFLKQINVKICPSSLLCFFHHHAWHPSKLGQWTLTVRGSITVWMVSCLTSLDSVVSEYTKNIPGNDENTYLVRSFRSTWATLMAILTPCAPLFVVKYSNNGSIITSKYLIAYYGGYPNLMSPIVCT